MSNHTRNLILITEYYHNEEHENRLTRAMVGLTQSILDLRRNDIVQTSDLWSDYYNEIANVKLLLQILLESLGDEVKFIVDRAVIKKAEEQKQLIIAEKDLL